MSSFECNDHKGQAWVPVAPAVPEPRKAPKQEPVVRLAKDDFDGVYDDKPAQASAAA